ncbi:MAG: metallophosphoesterase family protein [Gammaproteobacteria bacterium]|nr:metallophosphoesterase family protein [Gammaproteobacteria bacterium]
MTCKIGLISDVHASPEPLRQALAIFERENVTKIICAGDLAGYFDQLAETIELLKSHACDVIIGNHDQEFLDQSAGLKTSADYLFLQSLPETREYKIEDKKLYVVHAHPPALQHGGIKLLDQNGKIIPHQKDYWTKELAGFEYDVLIVGHTHQVFAEQLGNTLVANPGSTQFNHSCQVLSLPDLTVQTFALGNKEIVQCWNFSYLFRPDNDYPPMKK